MGPIEINAAISMIAGIAEMVAMRESLDLAGEDPLAAADAVVLFSIIETQHARGEA